MNMVKSQHMNMNMNMSMMSPLHHLVHLLSSFSIMMALTSTYTSTSTYTVKAEGTGTGTIADLELMLARLERDTAAFAREMERLTLATNRCSEDTIRMCSEGSYHACESELPYASCPGYDYAIKTCGKGKEGGCGALFDFTSSIVSVAPDSSSYNYGNEESDRIKDHICATLPAEQYMTQVTDESTPYWNSFSVNPPWLYFGSDDGVFRFLPGTPWECPGGRNYYDPRIRPWYVAASSGPKDVILVLDTSGSMENVGRMSIMKEAAKRVVNTLGITDYFAVLEFNDYANMLQSDSDDDSTYNLIRATSENKEKLVEKIDGLKPGGGTNFYRGFQLAFDIFRSSAQDEKTTSCHQAILFLTDGAMGDSEVNFFSLLDDRIRDDYENKNRDPPVMFTYSFGSGADETIPKKIACNYRGIWADIKDGGNLSETMGAYYKYFAYGLSTNDDTDDDSFVAWVEPYEYNVGVGLGTTASAPVYDRSVDPPILAGVVGMDISFAAMEKALGKDADETKEAVINRIVSRSAASCHKLELTDCQLESLRRYGSSNNENNLAVCNTCDESDVKPLKSALCENTEYPNDIWNNRYNKGRTYEERVCCHVGAEPREANEFTYGEIKSEHVCVEKSQVGLIVGLTVAGVILSAIFGFCILRYIRRRKEAAKFNSNLSFQKETPEKGGTSPTVTKVPIRLDQEDDIVVMPPPTAPMYSGGNGK